MGFWEIRDIMIRALSHRVEIRDSPISKISEGLEDDCKALATEQAILRGGVDAYHGSYFGCLNQGQSGRGGKHHLRRSERYSISVPVLSLGLGTGKADEHSLRAIFFCVSRDGHTAMALVIAMEI
jgi:hypothetical protein